VGGLGEKVELRESENLADREVGDTRPIETLKLLMGDDRV